MTESLTAVGQMIILSRKAYVSAILFAKSIDI